MSQTYETGFRTTLAAKLNAADTTITVATAPTVTAGRMHIYRGSDNAWIKYTGVTGTTLTGVTFVSQTLDPATTVTGQTFPAGTSIELVEMHDQMLDKQQGGTVAGAMTFSDDVTVVGDTIMGSTFLVPVYATTTARDAAITVPVNGMEVYITADGMFYDYQGGIWGSRATGTSTPNASTTVAGKVELPTTPEMQSNAQTGGTGAALALSPAQMALFYSKGDGSDGSVVFDGAATILGMVPSGNVYTMTRDIYTVNCTVNTGISINPAGYAIYSNGTMTLTGTAKLIRTGVAGGNGTNLGVGGTAGTALATGTCGANLAGGVGGTGGTGAGGNGTNGVAVSPSYCTTATASVAGGTGAGTGGGAGPGTAGTSATATQGALYNVKFSLANILAELLIPARGTFNATAYGAMPSSGSGSSGGGNGGGQTGGGGGGSGSNGGIIMVFANIIAGSGTISAIGGAGGNGGNGQAGSAGGGGGGSGGSGGTFLLVYNTGTPWTATLTGGAAGTAGTGGSAPTATNGSIGTTGQSILINV